MHRTICQYALLAGLLVAGVISPVMGVAEESCACYDQPDNPCITQELTLASIEFPYQVLRDGEYVRSCYHKALYEAMEKSEVWVIIEVKPGGRCHNCTQTYLLYRPRLDVPSGEDFEFALNDPGFTASDVVFSMAECSPLTPYKVTVAIIEEDQSYTDVIEKLARIVPPRGFAVLNATGSRKEEAAEEAGWSVRIEAPMLEILYHAIVYDAYDKNKPEEEWDKENEIVLEISSWYVHSLDFVGLKKSPGLPEETGEIRLRMNASSEELSGGYGCSREDADREMQAETLLKKTQLSNSPNAPHPPTVREIISNAPSGYHEYPAGSSNLPPGAVRMAVSKRTVSTTGASGTSVFKAVLVAIRFQDGSIYVYDDSVKEWTSPDGKSSSGSYHRADGAFRTGSERSKSRKDAWDVSKRWTQHYVWGSSADAPLRLWEIIAPSNQPDCEVNELVITTGAGGTLDLTGSESMSGLFGTSGDGMPALTADDSITIYADDVLLDPRRTLSGMATIPPIIHPGSDGFHLILPEGVGVLTCEDVLPIGVMSWASSPQTVSLTWEDSRGWVAPGTMAVYLPAGGMTFVNLLIHAPEGADLVSSSSMLTLTAISQSLGSTEGICELIAATSVDADDVLAQPAEEAPAGPAVAEETPEPDIPEEILACTEDLGEASGIDYRNSGFLRYTVSVAKRLGFFKDEVDAYLKCTKLGPCARKVKAWLNQAPLELQKELAEVFWAAFEEANR